MVKVRFQKAQCFSSVAEDLQCGECNRDVKKGGETRGVTGEAAGEGWGRAGKSEQGVGNRKHSIFLNFGVHQT